MAATEPDLKSIQVTCRLLEDKAAALCEQDSQVLDMLLDDGDAELDTEMALAEEYQAKYIDRKLRFELNQTSNDGTSHAAVSKVQGSSRNLWSSGLLHGVVW